MSKPSVVIWFVISKLDIQLCVCVWWGGGGGGGRERMVLSNKDDQDEVGEDVIEIGSGVNFRTSSG